MSRAIGYTRAFKILSELASVDDRKRSNLRQSAEKTNPCNTDLMSNRTLVKSSNLVSRRAAKKPKNKQASASSIQITNKDVSLKRGLSPIYLDELEANQLPLVLPRTKRNRIVFGWYGGKFSHLDWLLPLLPKAHHYCEPFSGSAAVLLNREPSAVETYNDIDGEAVNFFRVLRDYGDEIQRAIALTPFSREEFHRAISGSLHGVTDLERARRFYIRARQTRTGLAQTATLGRWANCKDTSRAGMSGVVSRWLGGVDALADIATRLIRVQIENRPALDVIRLYDSKDTFFYCDPPYLHDTRGDSKAYGFEMQESEHINLAVALNRCRGKVAISGYRNRLMDKLYKGWRRFDAPLKQCHSIKKIRQECLWMNY